MDQQTDRKTDNSKAICPPFFEWGHEYGLDRNNAFFYNDRELANLTFVKIKTVHP